MTQVPGLVSDARRAGISIPSSRREGVALHGGRERASRWRHREASRVPGRWGRSPRSIDGELKCQIEFQYSTLQKRSG